MEACCRCLTARHQLCAQNDPCVLHSPHAIRRGGGEACDFAFFGSSFIPIPIPILIPTPVGIDFVFGGGVVERNGRGEEVR